ncbi:MAG TPA: PLP-dependent transferase [Thermoanaerobaculia bacterium]|nr:PLP-dependent transferase [Thermoanaerobaculia bacterium]
MKPDTMFVRAGHRIDPSTGAVAPPIHLSTTFARDAANELLGATQYIREGNPTQSQLEDALAPLEGGQAALAFASGMAAGTALLQTLPSGTHLILPDDAYYGYRVAAFDFLRPWGISTDLVAMDDLAALQAAIRPETRFVWLESPSNPLMKVTDLAGAIAIARRAGAATIADNTFATPVLQNPIALGADVVLHSTTKYIGGHSDLQGGALVFARRDALYEKAAHARHILGGVASPFNSWLALRGLRTLPLRMARHSASAMAIAEALARHPAVSRVHYPGLASDPGHAVARRQMSAFGGMLSFRVRAGREAAIRAVGRARLFTRATSLGGTESLIEHRATSEGPASRTPPDLLRLSVGLEHPDDLIEDLDRALSA